MLQHQTTVFIDESGTLPDIKDKVIIVAAVGTKQPVILRSLLGQVLKNSKLKKSGAELKFYTASDRAKTAFFEKIIKEDLEIFILIVEKMGRKIPDTPENFAIVCALLLTDVLSFYPQVLEVVFDRHFSREQSISEFNLILENLLDKKIRLRHADSQKEKAVNAANMIAGATLAKETGKNKEFFAMIREKIITVKTVNWPEAKRHFFTNKNLPEPAQTPILARFGQSIL